MVILLIKTDQAEAYIGLSIDNEVVVEKKWQAKRELSDSLLKNIEDLLKTQEKDWHDLEAINIFKGPGSYTGLRIGATVANTLSDSLVIPLIGSSSGSWIDDGNRRIINLENDNVVVPEYGGEAHITQPRK